MKKIVLGGILGVALMILVSGILVRIRILHSIDRIVEIAVQHQQAAGNEPAADKVMILLTLVQDESADLRDRNRAVWALGELRDSRAVEPLFGYYDGPKCQHESDLCQRELSRAVLKCLGNIPDLLLISATWYEPPPR